MIGGFKVPMGQDKFPTVKAVDGDEVTLWDIAHTEKLALMDGEGYVRGYYSTDKDSLNKMMIDVGLLYNRAAY